MAVSTERQYGLAPLRDAYLGRHARHAGSGVVGLIGNTIPVELVLACGRVPTLITADLARPTPNADVFMEGVIPPETKALFESAATGELESLDLLILSRAYAHLYYYLKEVFRLGRGPRFPALHIFDLMQSQRDAVGAYNWGRFEALIERLERVAGRAISDSDLAQAVAATNRVRARQRQLLALRWKRALSGVDALTALGAAYFMAPDDYATAMDGYLASLEANTSASAGPRLLVVTSEPLSHTRLHAGLEDGGGVVVAEDDWWGARAPGADISTTGSPREAVFQKYWLDTASNGVYPATAREAWLREHALRSDVDGVVFYLPPSDHQLGWDYPRLNGWLSSNNKRTLLIRVDATTPDGFEAVRAQARTFVEALA